ncbi:DUF3037 domain-containing protein [Tianweitania sediminis]|uniref:DUF3037 domain-containing protein n=1 Tax=Tianweitania sediminis TaxID=1502156 RepID=A0A8J7R2D8_9HYPH|nr:DUF3037 domain-containing protein [Tianweitania sediminis]MBP0439111.1 DUF3037 domain-containing protein [Tianweitania sediminis]
MRENQGYFALVQYSEHPERAEFVNIGVVLFASRAPHISMRFAERPTRVDRVFDISVGSEFSDLKSAIRNKLMNEFSGGWDPERVKQFIQMRSGKVRLSTLRSILILGSMDEELKILFDDLVGDILKPEHGAKARTKLKNQLALRGVEGLLDRPRPVSLPSGLEVKAHYGYQNGAYNLLKAVSLQGSPDSALDRASPHMIEGKLLFDHTGPTARKKLVVIGDVANQEASFIDLVEEQMHKHDVGFYRLDQIEPLVSEIRKSVGGHH